MVYVSVVFALGPFVQRNKMFTKRRYVEKNSNREFYSKIFIEVIFYASLATSEISIKCLINRLLFSQ